MSDAASASSYTTSTDSTADEARGRARTALFGLVAGSIALVGALYTARTFALNRRGQITERFGRAIEQLGDERTAVRLGGIYALERIAHESSEEHGPIVEVLTAYVRENSRWSKEDRDPPDAAVEIKAILSVLSRRNVDHERGRRPSIDLSATNLRGISARGIDLVGKVRSACRGLHCRRHAVSRPPELSGEPVGPALGGAHVAADVAATAR